MQCFTQQLSNIDPPFEVLTLVAVHFKKIRENENLLESLFWLFLVVP